MEAGRPYQSVEVIPNVDAERSDVRSIAWLDARVIISEGVSNEQDRSLSQRM